MLLIIIGIPQLLLKGDDFVNDFNIVEAFLVRDEKALSMTKEKYGALLRGVSVRIVQNTADAEECESDCYLELWNRIPPNKPYDYFFTFAKKIIRNISLNLVKKKNTVKRNALVSELSSELEECVPSGRHVEKELDDKQFCERMNNFLYSQKELNRNVFILRYWYCMPVLDIAKKYSVSESKVKSILFRMRNKLKEFLERDDIL